MLNKTKLLGCLPLVFTFLFVNISKADTTFEGVGTVNKVNKIAKIIILDGQRMLIDGNVQVTVNNTQHHLLNVLEEGALLTVSGIKDKMNNFIVTSSFMHHAPTKN